MRSIRWASLRFSVSLYLVRIMRRMSAGVIRITAISVPKGSRSYTRAVLMPPAGIESIRTPPT